MIRIIGLDPGLRNTGWGIISFNRGNLSHIAHGVVHSVQKDSLPDRLQQLFVGLQEILKIHAPDEAAVEETFVNTNATSTLKLGMARGVVMLAPACAGLNIGEYSANKVKKTVVGAGHADKHQVAMMVQRLLPAAGEVKLDAADALAVAICHAWHRETLKAWSCAG